MAERGSAGAMAVDMSQRALSIPDTETVEQNRMFADFSEACDALGGEHLAVAAKYISTLSEVEPARPLNQCSESELRALLAKCADALYDRNPGMLNLIDCFLDTIVRASLVIKRQQPKLL